MIEVQQLPPVLSLEWDKYVKVIIWKWLKDHCEPLSISKSIKNYRVYLSNIPNFIQRWVDVICLPFNRLYFWLDQFRCRHQDILFLLFSIKQCIAGFMFVERSNNVAGGLLEGYYPWTAWTWRMNLYLILKSFAVWFCQASISHAAVICIE